MAHMHVTAEAIRTHDLQRRLSPAAERALVRGLRERLTGTGCCLDAGVGTGSIALPLARLGVPIVGVDVSREMLEALRTKGGANVPFPLVQGDLIRLPFQDGAFGAALAANVFHLIAAWRGAAAELVRVVQPGGFVLVNLGGGDTAKTGRFVRLAFEARLGDVPQVDDARIGPRNPAEFDACLAALGATGLRALRVRNRQVRTLEQVIARLEHNPFAWPGGVDPGARARAADETRIWAAGHLGPLDRPQIEVHTITYRVYRTGH